MRIEELGDDDHAPGTDTAVSLMGVFSSNSTLLAASQLNRVPGAIPVGAAAKSSNIYFGSQPTDVPGDFWISATLGAHETTRQVPAGATRLFLAPHDSYDSDNSDPDADFGARFTVAPAPLYAGTAEDLVLRSGVDAPATSEPLVKNAAAGALLTIEVDDFFTSSTGSL